MRALLTIRTCHFRRSGIAALAAILPLTTAIALVCGWGGCGGSGGEPDDELTGLVFAEETLHEPVPPARAAKAAKELARAIATRYHRAGETLGPHRFRGTSAVEVSAEGQVVEDLKDETGIDFASPDRFHAWSNNSKDYGRDVYYVDRNLYLRPRYGKFHLRSPTDKKEPARISDEIFDTLNAHFDLVAPAAAPVDKGPVEHAGRAARRIELQMAKRPRARRREKLPQRAWRNSVTVREVSGSVVLDDETGIPLAGDLKAVVSFVRAEQALTMSLAVHHEVTEIGGSVTIDAPAADSTVSAPRRSRERDDRERLLQGIAPPERTEQPAADRSRSGQP